MFSGYHIKKDAKTQSGIEIQVGDNSYPYSDEGCRWEAATTEISRHCNPKTMIEKKQVAQSGGNVAKHTRKDIERQIVSVISSEKALDYLLPAADAE